MIIATGPYVSAGATEIVILSMATSTREKSAEASAWTKTF